MQFLIILFIFNVKLQKIFEKKSEDGAKGIPLGESEDGRMYYQVNFRAKTPGRKENIKLNGISLKICY